MGDTPGRRSLPRFLVIIGASLVLGTAIVAGQAVVFDPGGTPVASFPGDVDVTGNLQASGGVTLDGSDLDLNGNTITGGDVWRSFFIPVTAMTHGSNAVESPASGGQGRLPYLEIAGQNANVSVTFILPEDYRTDTDIGFCGHSSTQFASGTVPIETTFHALSDIGYRGTAPGAPDGAAGSYNTTQTTDWNYGNPDWKAFRTCDVIDVSGVTAQTTLDARDLVRIEWTIPDGLDGSASDYDHFMLGGVQIYYHSTR